MKTNLLIILSAALLTFSILITYDRYADMKKPVETYCYSTDSTQVIVSGKDLKITINHVNK